MEKVKIMGLISRIKDFLGKILGIRFFFFRHPYALAVIICFCVSMVSFYYVQFAYGLLGDTTEETLGPLYPRYLLSMIVPIITIFAIPFIWGLWFQKWRLKKLYNIEEYKGGISIHKEVITFDNEPTTEEEPEIQFIE